VTDARSHSARPSTAIGRLPAEPGEPAPGDGLASTSAPNRRRVNPL